MTEKDKDGRPKKGGRPSKNITDKLTCKITVKLCHRDYFSFLIEAHAAGMRPSALARAAITGVRIVPRLTREEMEWMRGLYGMSRNLNQLAKMGHISGYPEVSAQNEKLAKEISGIIAQMLHDRKHLKG